MYLMKREQLSEEDIMVRYWLVVGSPKNWHTAFAHGNILRTKFRQIEH